MKNKENSNTTEFSLVAKAPGQKKIKEKKADIAVDLYNLNLVVPSINIKQT